MRLLRCRQNRTKILPKQYKRDAFYLCFGKVKFRVYKVEYFFSSVGGAFVLEFFISYRDLNRFKRSKFCEHGAESWWLAGVTMPYIKEVLKSLSKTGVYNVPQFLF